MFRGAVPRRLAHRGFQRTRLLCRRLGIEVPTRKALDALGDPFQPYRSVVAYYTWKVSADPDLFATSSVRAVRRRPPTAKIHKPQSAGTKSSIMMFVRGVERTTSERSRDGLQWKDNSRWQQ